MTPTSTPEGRVDAFIAALETGAGPDLAFRRAYPNTRSQFWKHLASDLRSLLERGGVADAFRDGFLTGIAHTPWEDMHDWLALVAAEYAKNPDVTMGKAVRQGFRAPLPGGVVEALFQAIEHGDEAHRAWLRDKLETFFASDQSGFPTSAADKANTAINGAFVAGDVWAEEGAGEDGETIWTSEIQSAGGYSVIATVHATTEEGAIRRRDLVLAAISKAESLGSAPSRDELYDAAVNAVSAYRDWCDDDAAKWEAFSEDREAMAFTEDRSKLAARALLDLRVCCGSHREVSARLSLPSPPPQGGGKQGLSSAQEPATASGESLTSDKGNG